VRHTGSQRDGPRRREAARLLTLSVAFLGLLILAGSAQARLQVRVLARIGPPGFPSSTVVTPDGTIYASTFKSFTDPTAAGPSKVLAYSSQGKLERTYTVQGETPGTADAAQVATMDRSGTLYLLDQSPARIVKLDPQTGKQTTWATFRTLPACTAVSAPGTCSDGEGGNPPEPDFAAWGPDGSLYVTDYNQALIWRVPPTGGPAQVWLTNSLFNGVIVGPAGIQLMPDHRTLMVDTGGGGTDPSTGKLYTLPIKANGAPGQLRQIWESAAAEAPDGFALAGSGDAYVSLVGPSGNAVVEVSPQGKEIARVPQSAAANQTMAVPFDAPGSVSFDGDNLIVTNESSLQNDSAHWALLEITAGEPGQSLYEPPLPKPKAKLTYRLRVTPSRPRAGRKTGFRFVAVKLVDGVTRPVAGARIWFDHVRKRTGKRGRVTIRRALRHRHRRYRAGLYVGGHRVVRIIVRTR
jgi:sugar lactone lactonase YvrE